MEARRNNLKRALGAGCALAVLALATGAAAQQRTFNIASSKATDAIPEFARQAGIQIVAPADRLRGVSTPAITGQYDTRQALAMLIEGTGLRIVSDDGRTIMLAAADPQSGSAAGAGAEVEALIVTAQKREEDIQDVPIAISAFTQEDLTRSQVAGGPDLITQVPNMTFTKTNFSSYSIQIRGIGTQAISATTDAAVAVAFNNSSMIRNRFFEQEFYDLERVEVLRGPQGTLYGRNATAGVVNIISAKPKFYAEAKASADVSNYNSTRVEGMVNIPLVEDMVALRLAGAWTKRDGYATNEITGEQIDGRDLWSTRLSLGFEPTDRIRVNLIWEHFEENDDRLRSGKQLCKKDVVTDVGGIPVGYYDRLTKAGQGTLFVGVQATFSQGCARESLYSPNAFQTPNGLMLPYYLPLGSIFLPTALDDPYVSTTQSKNLRAIESIVDPDYKANADVVQIQARLDISQNLTLDSETVYGADALFSLQDFNRFNTAPGAWRQTLSSARNRPGVLTPGPNGGIFCDPQLGCSDRLVAVDISSAESRQFSQELRLSSSFDGPFNFSVGANYLRYDTEDKYYVFINSLSLISAIQAYGPGSSTLTPYVPGVTDGRNCLYNGLREGDVHGVYPVTYCTYMDPNPIGSLNDRGHNYFLSKNPYKLISYAAFGEVYYSISKNVKLTGGLRFTVDKKEAPRVPSWLLASESFGYPVAEVIEQEWREPTGRLAIDWKPDLAFSDETLLYASYAHGYKAGGANPPGFIRSYYASSADVAEVLALQSETRPKAFAPEYVDAFELGAKNRMLDGALTLNLAGFFYDYEGYQISEIVERSAYNRNFDAIVWGFELEADWRPLENLRLGFKGGYQKTRIADGEQAIDLMDRTAGRDDWLVVRPFPTQASSCILPTYVYLDSSVAGTSGSSPVVGGLRQVGNPGGGGPGGCELAYVLGIDPQTGLDYVPNPTVRSSRPPFNAYTLSPGYPGFDPLDASQGHNFGEGFFKDLSGNELPNAPNWTATLTADYTLPLPNDWLATLRADLHWQSESWWRVFNDHEYNKIDEYFTANIAAIFTHEEQGWNIMAYVKNVTDETAITGAFLNSDDTGLTTNVFLTEPRLYGLRVTKAWTGGPLLGGYGERRDGPYPFTLELGGYAQRHDAGNGVLTPDFMGAFSPGLTPLDAQNRDLDWGDSREVRLSYRPEGSPWRLSAGVRFGKTNGDITRRHFEEHGDSGCLVPPPLADFICNPASPSYNAQAIYTAYNFADHSARSEEEHSFVDFAVAWEIHKPMLGARSSVSLGLRHGSLESGTRFAFRGVPDYDLPDVAVNIVPATFNLYQADLDAKRTFEGAGPVLSWDASSAIWGDSEIGRLDVAWSINAGALLGERSTTVTGFERGELQNTLLGSVIEPVSLDHVDVATRRNQSATVPFLDLSLGLSYEIDRMAVSAGYRWERYFDAIDGGYDHAKSYDRTIDGPYFKIAVGFGG